jgi:hypothetical protein
VRFFETLAAYEQLLSEKNHSNTVASQSAARAFQTTLEHRDPEIGATRLHTERFQVEPDARLALRISLMPSRRQAHKTVIFHAVVAVFT